MIPFPAKKYNVIYADPPWAFRVWSEKGKERSADKHYSCMTLDDLKQMPVNSITAGDGCALFMWATFPMLREALELIEAWGFEYKTIAFCWVKQNKNSDGIFKGMGYYTRSNAEICLLATRGRVLERKSRSVSSVIISHIERHSKKPAETRDRIVELFGDLPRIELFARETAPGWDWAKPDNRQHPLGAYRSRTRAPYGGTTGRA